MRIPAVRDESLCEELVVLLDKEILASIHRYEHVEDVRRFPEQSALS